MLKKGESFDDLLNLNLLMVNAFHLRSKNEIHIPMAYINGQFYPQAPYYINYALIGSTIGHELMHGFDINGKNFNKDGKEVGKIR